MLGNNWIFILNSVSWFASFILNFNALCDAYSVQIESNAMLLKNNRILWLILGITFGNYILTVSNKSRTFMALFCLLLNYLSMLVYKLLNFFMQALEKFKFYLILFVLESVHNLCKVHDLFFWFIFIS